MGFSPVECVVRYVGMEDRYTLKHSYVRLPGQAPSVIRAALRKRAAPELAQTSEPYVRGDLTIDYARRRVTVGGNPVELTDIEYRLLVELSANAGRALTHERLLQRVWGPDKGEDSGR